MTGGCKTRRKSTKIKAACCFSDRPADGKWKWFVTVKRLETGQ